MYYDMSGFDYGILDVVQVCCISESGGETIMTARFVERRMENSISMWKRMYSGATAVMRPGGC